MAQHTVVFEVYYDGDWHTVPTYNRQEITITAGRADQLQRVSPSCLSGIQVNNRDGDYSPRNPNGPLWGKIGRNTRCRLTVDGTVLFVGEVEAWPQRWTKGGIDRWVPIVAYGIMQRLGLPGQKAAARSALNRASADAGAVSYWPMEDGPDAGRFGSGLPDGSPLDVTAADLASVEDLPGSAPLAAFTAATALSGVITHKFESAWSIIFLVKFPAVLAGLATLLDVHVEGGAAYRWTLAADATTLRLTGYDTSGGTVFSATNTTTVFNALFGGEWVAVGLEADASGSGVVTWQVYDLDGFRNGFGVTTGEQIGSPREFSTPASSRLAGMAMGHLVALPSLSPEYVWPGGGSGGVTAAGGYAGEQAHERIERIGAENGIDVTVTGSESIQVGPQPVDSTLEICFDAANVDMGILHEPRDSFGLAYRCRATLENQTAALTLTYGQKEIGDNLLPTEDLDFVQNDVTVKRRDGASARSVQETGDLNVQDSVDDPQGVGRFPVELELNLYDDDQAVHHASWLRHLAGWPLVRAKAKDGPAWLAEHEAGHVVVASHLGLEIHHSTVDEQQDYGRPIGEPHGATIVRDAQDPWTNALVCGGGPAASYVKDGAFVMYDPTPHDVQEITRLVGADRVTEAVAAAHQILLERAHWMSAVSAALRRRGYLTGAELAQVIEAAQRAEVGRAASQRRREAAARSRRPR